MRTITRGKRELKIESIMRRCFSVRVSSALHVLNFVLRSPLSHRPTAVRRVKPDVHVYKHLWACKFNGANLRRLRERMCYKPRLGGAILWWVMLTARVMPKAQGRAHYHQRTLLVTMPKYYVQAQQTILQRCNASRHSRVRNSSVILILRWGRISPLQTRIDKP
jgi:hypothetical protein